MRISRNLFRGRYLLIIVASLAVAGIASAAVYLYISNSVKATANVASPIQMNINNGRDGSVNQNSPITIPTTGGGVFTFTTVAQNNAQNTINGYNVMVINETDGDNKLTGKEIAGLLYEDSKPTSQTSILGIIYVVEGNGSLTKLADYISNNRSDKKLVLMASDSYTPQLTTLAAGETRWNAYTITLAGGTVGTYDIYAQYVSADAGSLAAYAADQYAH